eukprot:97682-Chlamydomonas_euryale.AAC.2
MREADVGVRTTAGRLCLKRMWGRLVCCLGLTTCLPQPASPLPRPRPSPLPPSVTSRSAVVPERQLLVLLPRPHL